MIIDWLFDMDVELEIGIFFYDEDVGFMFVYFEKLYIWIEEVINWEGCQFWQFFYIFCFDQYFY